MSDMLLLTSHATFQVEMYKPVTSFYELYLNIKNVYCTLECSLRQQYTKEFTVHVIYKAYVASLRMQVPFNIYMKCTWIAYSAKNAFLEFTSRENKMYFICFKFTVVIFISQTAKIGYSSSPADGINGFIGSVLQSIEGGG